MTGSDCPMCGRGLVDLEFYKASRLPVVHLSRNLCLLSWHQSLIPDPAPALLFFQPLTASKERSLGTSPSLEGFGPICSPCSTEFLSIQVFFTPK